MMDAVAFMTWERVVPWKILSMTEHQNSLPIPRGFGSNNRDFPHLLKRGSQIWVVTRIAKERSLAARVGVLDVLDREAIPIEEWPKDVRGLLRQWKFVARADTSSKFFETNSAELVMKEYNISFAQKRTIFYFDAPLEDSFASCMAQGRQTVFLSHRREEERRFATALAREFRNREWSPWLDKLALPEFEFDHKPEVSSEISAERLTRLIKAGITESKFAVVINTGTFTKGFWTTLELDGIRRTGIPWFLVMRGGRKCECNDHPIYKRKPEDVVREILERYAARP
jgi:hypothetical protein